MTNDQILNKLIYNQKKVTYSNISDIFELNFKKISRLIPLLPSIKDDFVGIKKPSRYQQHLALNLCFETTHNLSWSPTLSAAACNPTPSNIPRSESFVCSASRPPPSRTVA